MLPLTAACSWTRINANASLQMQIQIELQIQIHKQETVALQARYIERYI